MKQTIGTCSICGGRVTIESSWYATIPQTPTCEDCGATAAQHGPVIPMRPARGKQWQDKGTSGYSPFVTTSAQADVERFMRSDGWDGRLNK